MAFNTPRATSDVDGADVTAQAQKVTSILATSPISDPRRSRILACESPARRAAGRPVPLRHERAYHLRRTSNCVVRIKPACCVIVPNWALPRRVSGPTNFGLFVAFSTSMRNSALTRPATGVLLLNAMS